MTSTEDKNQIIKKIGVLTEVDIDNTDISISHRIPFTNNGESESTPIIRHPGIVVKFTNENLCDLFFDKASS